MVTTPARRAKVSQKHLENDEANPTCRVQRAAPLCRHDAHHRLQPRVAADAADDEDVVFPGVRHGALCDLNEHRKHRFLKGEREFLG